MLSHFPTMNSLVIVLVVISIFRGSAAGILSTKDSASVKSNSTNNLTSGILNSLKIPRAGLLDFNSLVQKLNLTSNVNITNIISSLNDPILKDGLLDLKSLTTNLNLTNIKLTDVLSSLNVKTSNEVLDFTSLTQNLNPFKLNNSKDGLLDFKGLALKYVRNVEVYNVTTEDGYILKVFRIPSNCSNVVVLSHGAASTSDDFILRGYTSLVYMLAEEGYDVWVMNYRGNRYSRSHKTLDPDTDSPFWQYSMHEMGYYDLSAVIDFALNMTGQKQLSVVGHSEGTSTVFVLASTRPEYNNKIKVFVALSPVCYFSDSGLALTTAIRLGPIINEILLAIRVQELVGFESHSRKLIKFLCSQGAVGYNLCYNVVTAALAGYSPDNMDQAFLSTILGHYPAGTSRKNLNHYVQVGNSDRFAQYDYGLDNNKIYGSEIAPNYDLQKVTCITSLAAGKNDKLSGLKAAERLRDELPNVVDFYVVDYDAFNHVDFVYGKNAHEVVYPHVLDMLILHN